jgi:elongator complex protein 3
MSPKKTHWAVHRQFTPEILALARRALAEVQAGIPFAEVVRRHPLEDGHLSKSALVAAYHQMVAAGEMRPDAHLLARIRLKPVRTLSGVTTVTVLTKPYPCPGHCIFCPDEARMPKSYLPDEPGAMRAVEHDFDPYAQVASRLEALASVGHPTDKVELLILGGTFSAYRRDYQEWFVQRCFEAMNVAHHGEHREHGEEQKELSVNSVRSVVNSLAAAQVANETAAHRCVGLSVETRPDEVTPDELAWFRHLGVTKVQMGAQSLDDHVLELNQRGHTVAETHRAVALLRAAGFKIVLHWMPNLLGATLASDRADFPRLWQGLCPDEIKIYPTQLLESAPLYAYWQRGEYIPYTTEALISLIADLKPSIPRYCRVNRVIRDIPSTHVVAGNKRTSLRQDVHTELRRRGTPCQCIRCREVRGQVIETNALELDDLTYPTDGAEEHFLSVITLDDKITGFLRLSLPNADSPAIGLVDLDGAAIIREVHIFGQSLEVGEGENGAAQHTGLGTRLLAEAEKIALVRGIHRMAVISAVGTRQYYLDRGFERGNFYLVRTIP